MKDFLFTNILKIAVIFGVILGVILIAIGGIYYHKHLETEKTLEAIRNLRLDYPQWHLPENAKARIGTGLITSMQYSTDGNLLALVSDIGVWILNPNTLKPLHLLAPHQAGINAVTYSPDGRTIAIGTESGTVQLWDTATGKKQKTIARQEYYAGVDDLSILPDNRTIAVVYQSMLDLLDITTGKPRNRPPNASKNDQKTKVGYDPYMFLSLGGYKSWFSPDGKTVACETGTTTYSFWNIESGEEIRKFEVEQKHEIATFNSDLRTLATASKSEIYNSRTRTNRTVWNIDLYDIETDTHKQISNLDTFSFPFLVFSPDGDFIASSIKESIYIWDVSTGKEKIKLKGHRSYVSTVAFSPDGKTLVSLGTDDTLRVWDLNSGEERKNISGYDDNVYSDVLLTEDAQTVMIPKWTNRTIRLWNAHSGKHKQTFIGPKEYLWDVAFSSDGSRLATRSMFNKGTIHFLDAKTGQHSKLKGPRRHVSGIAFRKDGKMLASWGSESKRKDVVQIWNFEKSKIKRILRLSENDDLRTPEDEYFDNKIFATIGKFVPDLFVWNLVTGDYNFTNLGKTEIYVARFSPDGKLLAIVFDKDYRQKARIDNKIQLWEVESGNHISTFTGQEEQIKCIAFSPDSKTIACGGSWRDKQIYLWDIETDTYKSFKDPSWKDKVDRIHGVSSTLAFSPNGQTLASGMEQGDIYLFDIATGAIKKTLQGHTKSITHIYFSSDMQTLVSVGWDGTILIWEL